MELRDELKTWEKAFAAQHGRKPGRLDIKAEPLIAAKYREYQATLSQTPQKTRVGQAATPQAIRSCLGPTPRRNGQILGLFDSPVRSETATAEAAITPVKGRPDDEPETPAFLHRSIDGFKPKRGLARSFSSILQDLRDTEDAKHDADWEVLREIEDQQEVGEQQDAEGDADDKPETGPRRKRGLKRQTKQVKMKPRPRVETTSTSTRKVNANALAHTNFCRLKIKAKGRFK